MSPPPRIYLDNAATSWPKPPEVYAAVDEYQRNSGAPAGRGAYAAGNDVQRRIAQCRRQIAQLIGAGDLNRIVFAFNGTDALNIALHGIIRPGDHVVTSVAEHNSVLRPLRWLVDHCDVDVTYAPCDGRGVVNPDEIIRAITAETRLVALTHASNVTGALQPIAEVGQRLPRKHVRLLVDAAQSLGHVPIDVAAMHIDLLAASGHKGLLGPLGTGLLYVGPGCEDAMHSFRQGGTGTHSETDSQPDDLPHKFEAGNLNVPGLLGLAAGADYVCQQGLEALRRHELELSAALQSGLAAIDGVRLIGPPQASERTGVMSFTLAGMEPQEVATLLDSAFDVEVRAGLHCAPRMHEMLGTAENGGTVRMSLGPFNTLEHVEAAASAVEQIASSVRTIK